MITGDLVTLVNSDGIEKEPEGEELGLLLYTGGTVCGDTFDKTTADAFCRRLGYTCAKRWSTEDSFAIQEKFDIKLSNVKCRNSDWGSCTFSEEPLNCEHENDVFLSCSSEYVFSGK